MNLEEFAALRPGDEIRNDMTHSDGVVISIDNSGVRVAWGGNTALPFTYGANSTAWFHWSAKPKPSTLDQSEGAAEMNALDAKPVE